MKIFQVGVTFKLRQGIRRKSLSQKALNSGPEGLSLNGSLVEVGQYFPHGDIYSHR